MPLVKLSQADMAIINICLKETYNRRPDMLREMYNNSSLRQSDTYFVTDDEMKDHILKLRGRIKGAIHKEIEKQLGQ